MWGGYADVAAYTGPSTYQDHIEPEELIASDLLPIYRPIDPWYRDAPIKGDFILIAEFSEQVGPKPVITIPKDVSGAFDQNHFAVKIMSVDYQHVSSGTFSLADDTQAVITDYKEGTFAYVHHFTLYDMDARGYVRPFCMTYLTNDANKLMSVYEEMLSEFRRVSRYFCYANKMLFSRDLERHIEDIKYTKEKLSQRKKKRRFSLSSSGLTKAEEQMLKSTSEETLNNMIKEAEGILDMVKPLLCDKRLEKRFMKLEERCKVETLGDSVHKQLNDSSSLNEEILDEEDPEKKTRTTKRRSFTFNEGDQNFFSLLESKDPYKPKILASTSHRRFDNPLRSLHELCPWGAKDGLNRLRCIHKYFSRDLGTLRIEKKESVLIDPPATLLTIGRCVAVNFLHNIDLNCAGANWCGTVSDRLPYPTNNLLRRWMSDDTLDSFKSAEAFFSAPDEGSPMMVSARSSFSAAFVSGSAYMDEPVSGVKDLSSFIDTNYDSYIVINSAEEAIQTGVTDSFYTPGSDIGKYPITSSPSKDSSFGVGSVNPDLKSINWDRRSSIDSTTMSSCSEDYSSWNTDIQQKIRKKRVAVVSAADHVCNLTSLSIGYGILQYIAQHYFSPELMYSLMTGRTVVVITSQKDEKILRVVINALWLFVPGHSSHGHAVMPCSTKPLCLIDLTCLKLVGICRPERKKTTQMVPSSLRGYVTILDLERNTLFAPPYNGDALRHIYQQCRNYKSDEAFISYIHCELLELAMKSYVYYHGFCISGKHNGFSSLQEPYWRAVHYNHISAEYIKKLGVHPGDVAIVEYLAEVIKMQQTEEWLQDQCDSPGLSADSGNTLPVKLDYVENKIFKA